MTTFDYKHFSKPFLFSIIIFLISFPTFNVSYGSGLDMSYKWALNYFFVNNYTQLTEFVYPIGPLAILKMPVTLGHNFLIYLIIFSLLKLLFLMLFFKLGDEIESKFTLLSIFLALFSAYFIHDDFLFVGCTFLASLLYYKNNKIGFCILASFLISISLLVKISIGVSSIIIFFSLVFYMLLEKKDWKKVIIQCCIFITVLLLVGMLVFKNLQLFLNYFEGVIHYTLGYSDGISLHPLNNWYLLSIFWISIFTLITFSKSPNFRAALVLLLFPFFASWKHGICRQDISHYDVLVTFILVFSPILILICKDHRLKVTLLLTIAYSAIFFNYKTVEGFKDNKLNIIRFSNFKEIVLNHKRYCESQDSLSQIDLETSRLNDTLLREIGNSSIDFYPWELSYAAINKLNWKPHSTLQFGGFSHWFDKKTSQDFNLENGPEKILFHYTEDRYGSSFGSLDGRHLLNDNPLVWENIISNYHIKFKQANFVLFEKNKESNLSPVTNENVQIGKYNTWIEVPKTKNEILRVAILSKENLLGKCKSILYKTEPFYIDYLFSNNIVQSYRYVPSNAQDGLWLNPRINYLKSNKIDKEALKFRIRSDDQASIKDNFEYHFMHSKIIDTTKGDINKYFQKHIREIDSTIVQETKEYTISPKGVLTINSKAFSDNFEFDLKKLWELLPKNASELDIVAKVDFLNLETESNLVIQISETIPEKEIWSGTKLVPSKVWINQIGSFKILRDKHPTGKLVIFVWNYGLNEIKIDNFNLKIIGQ